MLVVTSSRTSGSPRTGGSSCESTPPRWWVTRTPTPGKDVPAFVELESGGPPPEVTRGEPHLLFAQLAFQHRDLMAQGEDFHILVPVIHREQPEHGEHVRGGQVPKTKQHGRTSSRSDRAAPYKASSSRTHAARGPAL
jgi:hypothetical protein